MTPAQRKKAYETLEAISFDNTDSRNVSVDTSFDLHGVSDQLVGNLYNHFGTRQSPSGDIETGEEDYLLDFTFKGTITGFDRITDDCVMSETEITF